MAWAMVILFAGAAALLLWRFGKVSGGALQMTGAALLLGLTGYALQSEPSLKGAPSKAADEALNSEEVPEEFRKGLEGVGGLEAQSLALAEALSRSGRSRAAVSILREASLKFPKSPDIWVGLGTALMEHGSGQMNPAAQYSFEQAATIDPNHPAPAYFLGLSLAQAGKMEEAGEVWRALIASNKADAKLTEFLTEKLVAIGQAAK